MEQDMNLLISFLDHLKNTSPEHDEKVQRLKALVTGDPLLGKHKVLIFTEYRDTARYLYKVLKDSGVRNLFEIDSSTKVDRLEVIRRFAPYYNYLDESTHQKALAYPIRVLITTDILAEGLNLQEAFLLINYDLHWNPVRLMQRIGRVDRRMNPQVEERILASRPEEKDLRGKMWFWNFLPPRELEDILSLYNRVSHKVLRISETTGLEGQQLLTPDDHFKTLKDFNAAYEGQPSTEERLRLLLNEALKQNPGLEAKLEDLPFRLSSVRETPTGTTGIFACYRLPAIQSGVGTELGELKWYFLPDGSDTVLSSIEQIDKIIASKPDTPRSYNRDSNYVNQRLALIERYVQTSELKSRRSVTMAQMKEAEKDNTGLRLIAWMDINDDQIDVLQRSKNE
jgi:superfamily II DNA/RNA helicase